MNLFGIVDTISKWSGKLFLWLAWALMAVVVYTTSMRYFFGKPPIWGFETSLFIYGALILFGMAYTHAQDEHVRIDIVTVHLPSRAKLILELLGYILFFFPFVIIVITNSIDYAASSWSARETSIDPWHPPLYPLKTVIPVAFFLLFIQGVADFIQKITMALKGKV